MHTTRSVEKKLKCVFTLVVVVLPPQLDYIYNYVHFLARNTERKTHWKFSLSLSLSCSLLLFSFDSQMYLTNGPPGSVPQFVSHCQNKLTTTRDRVVEHYETRKWCVWDSFLRYVTQYRKVEKHHFKTFLLLLTNFAENLWPLIKHSIFNKESIQNWKSFK